MKRGSPWRAVARNEDSVEDPLGARIRHSASLDQEGEPEVWEVVGVVGDVRHKALTREPEPVFFIPYRQQAWPMSYLVLKTEGDPLNLAGSIKAEVAALDPTQPVFAIATLGQLVDRSLAQRRFASLAVALFALLALALASIGIYSVVAYTVSQRIHEVGVRMALGAKARDIVGMLLRNGLEPVALGLLMGGMGALLSSRFINGWLFELSPSDLPTYGGVAFLLLGVATLACFLPARRAARIDPLTALRVH